MRKPILTAALALAAVFPGPIRAADGQLDASFGTDAEFPGYGFYINPFGNTFFDDVVAVAPAPDGRLYLFGNIGHDQDSRRAAIYRLDADGYFDFDYAPFGLRTLIPPCQGGTLTDATVDSQGRPWLAFTGCGDFEIYRLTATGDMDTSLLGSGRLTVNFDLGNGNDDRPRRIALTPQGGIVIAGAVQSPTGFRLGIAHYTGEGGSAPGFGNAGRVDFDFEWSVTRIAGVHPMRDGRIVVAGDTQINPLQVTQFAVRVQPSGAPDASFGNSLPGVSEVDYRDLTDYLNGAPVTRRSVLEPDGSIIQVGTWSNTPNPNHKWDMFLMRWRPDGELDTGIGAFGYRLYGLNLGGNPEAGSYNHDGFEAIARQGDGKYVLAGYSYGTDNRKRITLTRLKRNFQLDTSFGQAGHFHDLVPVASNDIHGMHASEVLLRPGRIVTGLEINTGQGMVMSLMGTQNDLLFADTFD